MNPQDEYTHTEPSQSVPENDFLSAARAVETGVDPSSSDSSMASLTNSVRDIVSEYPGPSILIGAGLVWMLLSREQKYSRPLPKRLKDRAVHSREQLLDAAAQAKEEAMESFETSKFRAGLRAESTKLQAREKLDQARKAAEATAESAREAYRHVLDDNPMLLGACAMVAGLAMGFLIPTTQREDEMMGAQRDRLLEQARTIVDNARQAAVSTLRSGTENVKMHLAEAGESAKETLSQTVENVKDAATSEMGDASSPSVDSVP